ncbi:MAG: RNase P modulator RnpM [Candidatus Coproplasma sp.]
MPTIKKIPQRQCIACRNLKEKREMLRIVKNSDGNIFIDFSSKASGRGAYICDNPDCIKKLKKSRLLDKAFSCRVDDGIYSAVEEEYFGRKG